MVEDQWFLIQKTKSLNIIDRTSFLKSGAFSNFGVCTQLLSDPAGKRTVSIGCTSDHSGTFQRQRKNTDAVG